MQARQNDSGRQSRPLANTFAALSLNRAPRLRRNPDWVADRLNDPTGCFVLVWGSKVLVTDESPPRPTYLRPQDLSDEYRQVDSAILLGEGKEHTYFAIGWPSDQEPPSSAFSAAGTFRRLRSVATLLDGEAAALLAYAKGMVHYHERHRFCPTCGAPTVPEEGGHLRVCTDLHCGSQDFVRTDPAIIVLVRTQDRCLLARQPTWPGNLYSIIAGFVEPGESLEAAVAREVEEEAGIQVKDVRYQSSQPWPFPRSLMIGFTATATTTAIRLNDGELEDARWLSREDIARELIQGELQLPSPISISHRLIESWFDAEGSVPLRRIVGGR